MIIGYIRGKYISNNFPQQVKELKAYGCAKVFEENESSKSFNEQSVYKKMRDQMCPGDVLVIQDIKCLGRNKQEIKEEWKSFIDDELDIVILKNPVLDTRSCNKTGNKQHILKVVLSLISWMIDEEQSRIRSAQREGIKNAKKQGKFRGRKQKYHADATGKDKTIYEIIINELKADTSVMDIHRKTGVARSTIYNIKKRLSRQRI